LFAGGLTVPTKPIGLAGFTDAFWVVKLTWAFLKTIVKGSLFGLSPLSTTIR